MQSRPSRSSPTAAAEWPKADRQIRFGPNLYAIHTQPGFEAIAWSEAAARIQGVREIGRRTVPDRAGILLVAASRADDLAKLRIAEDIFALIAYRRGLGNDRKTLEQVRATSQRADYIESALGARTRLMPGSRAGRRLSFRVVARMSGDHEFRRIDFQRAVERGISERGDRRWRPAQDNADVEFWGTLLDDEFLLAVRLSDERMRHRDYKVEHRPASLRPAVAAALGWLSRPEDDDIVLDPACGAGTVLIERARLGRYKMLLGGDREAAAQNAAVANVGPRYKPIGLMRWDASRLPLAGASVTKIVTNLPWGLKSGSHEENRALYPRLIREFRRVLRPGGMMVLLTAETWLMREVLAREHLRPSQIFSVTILGAAAAVYVCRL